MRLRLLALGCGAAGVAIAVASLLPGTHSSRIPDPTPPADALTSRAPSAQPSPTGEPEYCRSLYKVICQKRGVTRDPTGIVRPDVDGELLALRMYEDIIRHHPDWPSDKVDEELAQQIYTPKVRVRITAAFKWVESAMERLLERQSASTFSPEEKAALESRLKRVELQLPPPVSLYADEPDLLTKNDVFYERIADGHTRLRVGGAYFFTAKSYFNLIFTLGHELAHSIDPCEVRAAPSLSIHSYARLTSCFLDTGVIARRPDRVECGANDQLSETFADWMGAQITAEALKSFALEFHGPQLLGAVTNAVRDLCEPDAGSEDELDLEFHPSPEIRIDRIFGQNAQIREILGCAPAPVEDTCGFGPKAGKTL